MGVNPAQYAGRAESASRRSFDARSDVAKSVHPHNRGRTSAHFVLCMKSFEGPAGVAILAMGRVTAANVAIIRSVPQDSMTSWTGKGNYLAATSDFAEH